MRRAVLLLLVAACGRSGPAADPPSLDVDLGEPDPDEHLATHDPRDVALGVDGPPEVLPWPTTAQGLLRRLECNRCHEGTSRSAPPDRRCVGCHQRLLADGDPDAPPADVARWREHLTSLVSTPSLAGVGLRLRREWVRDLLLAPGDSRPASRATMPRFPLSPADAELIAAYLVPVEAPPVTFDPTLAPRGAELYARHGCATCHQFTGAGVGGPPAEPRPAPAVVLAPDLAVTRARFQPGALVGFLRDPAKLAPGTLMPRLGLSTGEARALAAFVMTTPLAAPPPAPVFTRLPLLEREVTYAEVEERVLRKVCWHCHATAAYALGDGGAGNTGGFGYRPRGLDLSSAQGLFSGAVDDTGERRSVFAPAADGTPRLVAHLLARHREVAGELTPGITGMPLGLPPVPAEDLQLVETWIAQGRRLRPAAPP